MRGCLLDKVKYLGRCSQKRASPSRFFIVCSVFNSIFTENRVIVGYSRVESYGERKKEFAELVQYKLLYKR